MKKVVNVVFLILLIWVIFLGFFNIFPNYWSQHPYYVWMLVSFDNWKILITNFVISLIFSLVIFVFRKKIITLLVSAFLSLLIFGWFYISYKWGFLWGKWGFMWLINLILMYSLILVFLWGLLTLWDFLKSRVLKLDTKDIFGVIVNLGLWLSTFLIINYLLILLNLVYTFLSWFILIWLLIFFILKKQLLVRNLQILESVLSNLEFGSLINEEKFILRLLLIVSLMYLNYGFLMSWIPYPTAWDANHAYMFYPKMWAIHHWFYWNESNMNTTPYLWLWYITFWFSLFTPFYNSIWIAPDTWAVVMNFLSGLFVLIFGLAILWEILKIISANDNFKKVYFFLIWWFCLILWLTSWMGAFLVFVDNKTDLWVLSLIILALYGWFLAFRKIIEEEGKWLNLSENKISSDNLLNPSSDNSLPSSSEKSLLFPYLILSAFFFAVAVASKPTAFFDVVNFWVFVTANLLSISLAVWLIVLAIGVLAVMQFRWIVNYFTFEFWKKISIIWIIISGIWILEVFIKKILRKIYPLVVWGIFFVIFLVLIKWIWLVWEFIYYPERFKSLKQIVMTLFFW